MSSGLSDRVDGADPCADRRELDRRHRHSRPPLVQLKSVSVMPARQCRMIGGPTTAPIATSVRGVARRSWAQPSTHRIRRWLRRLTACRAVWSGTTARRSGVGLHRLQHASPRTAAHVLTHARSTIGRAFKLCRFPSVMCRVQAVSRISYALLSHVGQRGRVRCLRRPVCRFIFRASVSGFEPRDR